MAKQELDEVGGDLGGKGGGFKEKLLSVLMSGLKFILSILLLPFVAGISLSFFKELFNQKQAVINNFIWGLMAYLILHIFIYEPTKFYEVGQKIVEKIFSFFAPLKHIMTNCLSFYVAIVFILYFIFQAKFGYDVVIGYFIFLISFFSTMHLILTANALKTTAANILKGEYYFSLFLIFIVLVILISIFLSVMVKDFSYVNFIKEGFVFFVDTNKTIFKQLFVLKGK